MMTMTNKAERFPATNLINLARGLGRWHRRGGLTQAMAVATVARSYPALDGKLVARGWNDERSGR